MDERAYNVSSDRRSPSADIDFDGQRSSIEGEGLTADRFMEEMDPETVVAGYWATDTGTLDLNTRRTLLSLLRGPYLDSRREPDLWKTLLAHENEIRTRLSDLFLDLIVDEDIGIAFVRNPESTHQDLPKAVRSQPLTLIDTVMVLFLRRELLSDTNERVYIGREELFGQLASYRELGRFDEAGFRKKLDAAWKKLIKSGILHKIQGEDRCEISPVLPLVFGVEECRSVQAAFEKLLNEQSIDEGDDIEGSSDMSADELADELDREDEGVDDELF